MFFCGQVFFNHSQGCFSKTVLVWPSSRPFLTSPPLRNIGGVASVKAIILWPVMLLFSIIWAYKWVWSLACVCLPLMTANSLMSTLKSILPRSLLISHKNSVSSAHSRSITSMFWRRWKKQCKRWTDLVELVVYWNFSVLLKCRTIGKLFCLSREAKK